MPRRSDSLPVTLAAARAAITAQREALAAAEQRAIAAEARAAAADNEAKSHALLIEKLKFTIAKLRQRQFGQSAERGAILEQLELQLADLEQNASQAQAQAEGDADAAAKINVVAFQRQRSSRQPLPADLPRERLVHPGPTACPCCGGAKLRKIVEDVTEMLEHVPASWKVIQHVREKFSCRDCEAIAQTPAIASDRTRARRTDAARPHPVLQIQPASAAQSPEHDPCAGGHPSRRLDAMRLGRRRFGDADAAGRGDPRPHLCGRASPCR